MPVAALSACALLMGAHADHVQVSSAAPSSRDLRHDGELPIDRCRWRCSCAAFKVRSRAPSGFELWLPLEWNGRLLGAGVGGDAGVFNLADLSRRANEGFAAVTTDSGHKRDNARWMADPKARQDYEHRAVHLTAQAAKALVARFYGRAAEHSYFSAARVAADKP
jgi:feruloyl esterase